VILPLWKSDLFDICMKCVRRCCDCVCLDALLQVILPLWKSDLFDICMKCVLFVGAVIVFAWMCCCR